MYLHRTLEQHILRQSRSFPVILLTGARQVGKTTLLRHLGEQEDPARRYVSLDDYGPRSLAEDDPELFLQRFQPPLIIDEVQHVPSLLTHIKGIVDRDGAMGRYWLTGSQHFPLMRGVSESLAGRVGVMELLGLSHAEERSRESRAAAFRPDRRGMGEEREPESLLPLFERIVRGSFPRLVHPDRPPLQAFHGSYLQTYVERDVRALLNIGNLALFRRFLRVAASRVGQLLNYSDMARDVGVSVPTAREWLHVLEASFQVYLLRPYFENIGKRHIKTPKLYFTDTGLVCHLLGWRTAETAASGAMAGHLFECHVLSEILKSYRHRGLEPPIWFFRTKEKKEVDLLIAEDGLLFPVEVKLTATPSNRDISGMRALQRAGAPLGAGAVVCLARERLPLTRTVDVVPVGEIG